MRRDRYIICIVLIAVVVVLNLPAAVTRKIESETHDSLAPFQNVAWALIDRARGFFRSVAGSRRAMAEQKTMLEEIAVLREKVRSLEDAELENRQLREQLGFAQRQERELRLCEVIGRDISGWWQTVTLNRGSEDGIGKNMAVITDKGLIGQVAAVSDHTATVLLITDQTCKVACRLARSGGFGVVNGTGVSAGGEERLDMLYSVQPCVMDYIPPDHDVRPNDQVVTSGLGGVYPPGLLVGYVTGVLVSPSALYQRVEVVPAAEFRALKHVFVVQK